MELGCRCGEIHGLLCGVAPSDVNRVICYCDDCQAYLHQLGRADLFDAHGGTEIVQVAPSSVAFDKGAAHVVGLRLAPKGLYRWYAHCCKTPLGNTLSPTLPFIGMPLEIFRGAPDPQRRDEIFGQLRGGVFSKFAIGGIPKGLPQVGLGHFARALQLMVGWKIHGRTWPHPFFDRAAKGPRHPVTILTREERELLRAKCGPSPTVPSHTGTVTA